MRNWLLVACLTFAGCAAKRVACVFPWCAAKRVACVAVDADGVEICVECGAGYCSDISEATSFACEERAVDDQQSICGQLGFDQAYSACETIEQADFLVQSGGLIGADDCPAL